MTVRTTPASGATLLEQYPVPAGTPLHIHMWSLHNTSAIWKTPKVFRPDRWIGDGNDESAEAPIFAACSDEENLTQYDGAGHEEGGLSYFPFSAGERICPGRNLTVHILRTILTSVSKVYRLDPAVAYTQEDPGMSPNSVVLPAIKVSTNLKIRKRTDIHKDVEDKPADDGWADDSDKED